ncbi:MAG: toxic anion resistance protein [Pseudomonadales bacterium]|nr:toxic anion resistance protein [Pseudomonadales bacterium]
MSQLQLEPPAPVKPVTKEEVHGMVPIKEEEKTQLDKRVEEFVNVVISQGVDSQEFKDRVAAIHGMASSELKSAVSVSNRMMDRPVNAINQGLMDENSPVASALIDLRNTCQDLDPSKQGNLLEPRKLLGLIPFGNKMRDYFMQYESAQTHLNKTIEALLNGQDELRKDNAAIEQEKATLWELMSKIEQYIYLGKKIDEALEKRIAEIEAQDAAKARIVKEEMLFYVRQKIQDLLVNLAVNVQTYLSLDMVRKNNMELIKGVDRATTTTVQALRNAVMTAQALANQKLVLSQISALNETTSTLIQSTAQMLKQQGTEVAKQATEPAVQIETLKGAFRDIYEAIDTVNNYKVEALASMKQSIDVLEDEVGKAKSYMTENRIADVSDALEITDAKELEL